MVARSDDVRQLQATAESAIDPLTYSWLGAIVFCVTWFRVWLAAFDS
jgi:hypothetical protein